MSNTGNNARIQELIKKCTQELYEYTYNFGNRTTSYFNKNQFAELLIQECADWIRTNYDHPHAEGLAWNLEICYDLHGDYA
jgi:hypothetical protein